MNTSKTIIQTGNACVISFSQPVHSGVDVFTLYMNIQPNS